MLPRFKHKAVIRRYERGTLNKCKEELHELQDADSQSNPWHVMVEAADLINSTYTFVWKKYRIPAFVVIFISLMTAIYKPTLRWIRSLKVVQDYERKKFNEAFQQHRKSD